MKTKISLPSKINTDLAYLCGVLAGDGSLSHRPHKYEYVLVCVGNPKDEQDYYNKVIAPLFANLFNLTVFPKFHHKQTTFGISCYSKDLVLYLSSLGLPIGKKYDKLSIPKNFKKNKNLLFSFIKGVFDTDGCVCFKKRYRDKPYYPVVSFSSKSESFVKQVKDVLLEEDFNVVVHKAIQKDTRMKSGETIVYQLTLNGKNMFNLWMEKIGFDNPKHLKKIKKWKESSEGWI